MFYERQRQQVWPSGADALLSTTGLAHWSLAHQRFAHQHWLILLVALYCAFMSVHLFDAIIVPVSLQGFITSLI